MIVTKTNEHAEALVCCIRDEMEELRKRLQAARLEVINLEGRLEVLNRSLTAADVVDKALNGPRAAPETR